jgi:Secretion system C-terminal sorting domain
MKKVLLLMLSFFSLAAIAQSFTIDDTLSAGDAELYYTADSNAVNLDAMTGAGVTWDYSALQGYVGLTNPDSVKNATDSPDFGDFSNADYWDDLSGGASLYFTNYLDSVISYGYVFSIDGNIVKIMHNIDPLKTANIPMVLNDTYTDSTYGAADVLGSMGATEGDVVVIADGTGTLNLGASVFTNVIRIKLVESIETTITLPPPINTVTGTVTRTEYRYFDYANQNEPILIHATIDVASILFNGGYSAVYSSVALPILGLGFEDDKIENFDVYPNPATDIVAIASDNADVVIVMNALGQIIYSIKNPQGTEQIDVSNYETGIYFIQIKRGNATKTKKLIVK